METNTPDSDIDWQKEGLTFAEKKALKDTWFHCRDNGDVVTGNHVSVSSNVYAVVQHLAENDVEWEGRTVEQMPSTCLKYKSIYNTIAYLTKPRANKTDASPRSDQTSFQGAQAMEDAAEESSLLGAGTSPPTGTQTPIFSSFAPPEDKQEVE